MSIEKWRALARRVGKQGARTPVMGRSVVGALACAVALSACGGGGEVDGLGTSAPAAVEKVTVAWDPPETAEDGSALTNLAGYRIYYGLRSESYDYVVDSKDPNATTAELELPVPGVWYISAKSYAANGIESRLAEELVYEHDVL